MPASWAATSCAAEALDSDPLHAGHALELGEHRAQRVAAVQLVGAVGHEQAQRLGAGAADEEDEEVARGGIGPVQVLEHERDGLVAAEPLDQRQQGLEQPRLTGGLGVIGPCGTQGSARPARRACPRAARGRSRTRPARARPGAARRPAGRTGRRCRRARGSGRSGHARPRSVARASNSATRRLLPTPDSPATNANAGTPAAAQSSAPSRAASSSARPTKVGLETRRSTTPMMEAEPAAFQPGRMLTGRRRVRGAGQASRSAGEHRGSRHGRAGDGGGSGGRGERSRRGPRRAGW